MSAFLETHKASEWLCVYAAHMPLGHPLGVASPTDNALITLNVIFSVNTHEPDIELLAFP